MPMLTLEIEGTEEQCKKFLLSWQSGNRKRIDGMKIQCVDPNMRRYDTERMAELSGRIMNGDEEAALLYLRELNGVDTR